MCASCFRSPLERFHSLNCEERSYPSRNTHNENLLGQLISETPDFVSL
jgi:hypothetical protein